MLFLHSTSARHCCPSLDSPLPSVTTSQPDSEAATATISLSSRCSLLSGSKSQLSDFLKWEKYCVPKRLVFAIARSLQHGILSRARRVDFLRASHSSLDTLND